MRCVGDTGVLEVTSEISMSERDYEERCRSATTAAAILQGKWRIPILCALQDGPVRLGRLGRLIPGASKKVIAENLRQLQRDGILVRTDMSDVRLHVEYDYAENVRSKMTCLLHSLAVAGELGQRT